MGGACVVYNKRLKITVWVHQLRFTTGRALDA